MAGNDLNAFFGGLWNFPLTRVTIFLFAVLLSMYAVTDLSALTLEWLFVGQPLFKLLTFEALQVVLVLLIMAGLAYFEKRSIISYGLEMKGAGREAGLGFVLGALLVIVVVGSLFLIGVYKVIDFRFRTEVIFALVFLSFAAFTEEVIFRGYVLQTIEKQWGTGAALLISSLIFGFAHMLNSVGGASALEKALSCLFLSFEAGLPLAACYIITRRLWMSVGMHLAWNFFEGPIFGTFVSGTRFGVPMVKASLTGPAILTGGAFGPEGSLSGFLIGTALGIWLSYRAYQQKQWIPGPFRLRR